MLIREFFLGFNEWFFKNLRKIWSRGLRFCPSLHGDRYRKSGSKSGHRAEILGNFVRNNALAPRPEVLRSFSCLYANPVLCVLCLRMCRSPRTELITTFVEQYRRAV